MQKVRANIYLEHIRENANTFKTLTRRKLCAVVKANAYGHGAEEVVNALEGIADFFAVALIEEGMAIRTAACDKDILVFTPPTDVEEVYALSANGLIATVGSIATAKLVIAACERYRMSISVHLKVNTGMNRYGMERNELASVCQLFYTRPYVKVRGIYTHLCEYTILRAGKQKRIFLQAIQMVKRRFPNVISHLGGTYAALIGEDFLFDAVRIGIGLYGYLPCEKSEETGLLQVPCLKKAMSVTAKTVATSHCRYGGIGYGKEYPLGKPFDVCALRFGYADGFLRKKENGVDGWRYNANHLCMDVCLREGKEDVGVWQTILSDAEETARWTDTIAYEVLCAATRRAEMRYGAVTIEKENQED